MQLKAFAAKKVLILVLLAGLLQISSSPAVQGQDLTESSVAAYLSDNEGEIRRKLTAYNRRHRIAADAGISSWTVYDLQWSVHQVSERRAWVEMNFWIGRRDWDAIQGQATFELAWEGGEPRFVGHRVKRAEAAPRVDLPTTSAPPPNLKAESDLTAYLDRHESELRRTLADYNKQHRLAISGGGTDWSIGELQWEVLSFEEGRAWIRMRFGVGRTGWDIASSEAAFELAWMGEELILLQHKKLPKRPPASSGWLSQGGEDCVHNYYAPNPCIGVIRAWIEFTDLHNLPLDPDSAKIYQAYRQNSFQLGDKLMARARGLPDPTGESVFGLHAEVRAMDLTQYQRGSDRVGCDLNPYSPRPCPEILQLFQEFAERHDLPADAATASMLEAYAQGNFKKADTIYALSKDLEVPAYGYLTTVAGKDVQDLRLVIARIQEQYGRVNRCSVNPYKTTDGTRRGGPRTCPEITRLWREFAERYQLEDNADMGRIFEQYANGEYRAGDQLLAQAKGVSLEQLLEASGVPTTKGLVIEVFPGLKRSFQKGRAGA